MKSRISYFDKTVFKKNLTRFAPAWGLCTVWLVLAIVTICMYPEMAGSNLMDMGQAYCVFSFLYAPLCTQLLFGDLLYNTRMCNALHALPLKRDTWFFTNVASGFAFFLIPTVTSALLAALLLWLGDYPGTMAVVPLWVLTMMLHFVCFFGISTFSAFFAGNRFAHAVVYGLINFGSMILGWMVENLYIPMYYGIQTNMDPFILFSPAARLAEEPFLFVKTRDIIEAGNYHRSIDTSTILRGENFGYCFIVAAVGLALLLAGLWLYRRRKLECAGDFIAIPGLKPVFSLVYTLAVGTFFHLISAGLFLLPGLIIGWFPSRMLVERTGRVFKKRNFLRGGALIGIFLLTLAVAGLDPLGIEEWVPEERNVESIRIYENHYYTEIGEEILLLEESEDVEAVIGIHRDCLEYYRDSFVRVNAFVKTTVRSDEDSIPLTISYQMKSGRTVNRYYYVRGQENFQQLTQWLSTPEIVFGEAITETEFLAQYAYVEICKVYSTERKTVIGQENLRQLYQAILADCEAGNMASFVNRYTDKDNLYTLCLGDDLRIPVYVNCGNTLWWIRTNMLDQ